jgi:hypothetical protein
MFLRCFILFLLSFKVLGAAHSTLPTPDEVCEGVWSLDLNRIKKVERNLLSYLSSPVFSKSSEETRERFKTNFWNKTDSSGLTPLQWSVLLFTHTNNLDMVAYLLDKKADMKSFPSLQEKDPTKMLALLNKRAPLLGLIKNGSKITVIFSLMRKNATEVSMEDVLLENPFTKSCLMALFHPKLDQEIFIKKQPLHLALRNDNLELAAWVLNNFQDLNVNERIELPEEVSDSREKTAERLDQATPLHYLVTASARIWSIKRGKRALYQEVNKSSRYQNQTSIYHQTLNLMETLIIRGADPRSRSRVYKKTPIDLIQIMGDRRLIQEVYRLSQEHSPNGDIRNWARAILLDQEENKQKAEEAISHWLHDQKKAQRKKNDSKGKEEDLPSRDETEIQWEEESYDWTILTWVRQNQEKAKREEAKNFSADRKKKKKEDVLPSSPLPKFLNLEGKQIPVKFPEPFWEHIQIRHGEVGNHDMDEEEIGGTLQNPLIVWKKTMGDVIRYAFFFVGETGEYLRVVLSKNVGEPVLTAVTAFRSKTLPYDLRDIEIPSE